MYIVSIVWNDIEKEIDGNMIMFTGKIHMGSLVCDGARIPRRPCSGDDGA